jgi:hypothetical protein
MHVIMMACNYMLLSASGGHESQFTASLSDSELPVMCSIYRNDMRHPPTLLMEAQAIVTSSIISDSLAAH